MLEVGRQRKNQPLNGNVDCCGSYIPILNVKGNDNDMDKRKAISIITNAAKAYHENLEDQKVLFVYGVPSEIKKYLQADCECINGIDIYEVAFHRSNFLHLVGVRLNKMKCESAINFYTKCLEGRLAEDDFVLAKDGSTSQKLDVIDSMMNIKRTAAMIGDFSNTGIKLYSEKIAGNTLACMGFVEDKYTKLNVPNTLLKKDIRDVLYNPKKKIYAILSKKYNDDLYSVIEKCDKNFDLERVEILKEIVSFK